MTDRILFIRPTRHSNGTPVLDDATGKVAAALHRAKQRIGVHGVHTCSCGVVGSTSIIELDDGRELSSFAVHYLAYHRDEVPADELAKVDALDDAFEDPKEHELMRPVVVARRSAL